MFDINSKNNSPWLAFLLLLIAIPAQAQLVNDPDINDNGVVNFKDLSILANCYLAMPVNIDSPCGTSDLDSNGAVDLGDVAALQANFLGTFPTPQEAGSLYPAPVEWPLSSVPRAMVLGDVNADSFDDIVFIRESDNALQVLLSAGDGTFNTGNAAVTVVADSIVLGNVVGDANLDLLVLDVEEKQIRVLVGNGAGDFEPEPGVFTVGNNPFSPVLVDINNDSLTDVLVANKDSNSVSILLGDANTVFASAVTIPLGFSPISFTVDDFDVDGQPDFIAVERIFEHYEATVFMGQENLKFLSGTSFSGPNFTSLKSGHIDNDGIPDLIIVSGDGAPVWPRNSRTSIFTGNGDGTFTYSHGFFDKGIPTILDLNGDGSMDLLRTGGFAPRVQTLVNDGSGTLAIDQAYAVDSFWNYVGDLNGDQRPDIVTVSASDSQFKILMNNGTGKFSAPVSVDFNNSYRVYSPDHFAFADLNGDSEPEVIATAFPYGYVIGGVDHIVTARNDGDARFTFATEQSTGTIISHISVAQYDNVGAPDLIYYPYGDGKLYRALGDGHGGFGAIESIAHDFSFHFFVTAIVPGDFNNDGRTDVLVRANIYDGNLDEPKLNLHLGSDDGGLLPPTRYFFPGVVLTDPVAIDINGDDALDGVAIFQNVGIGVLAGNGQGELADPVYFDPGIAPTHLAAADFNADGFVDLLSMDDVGTVSILLGQGMGTFAAPFLLSTQVATGAALLSMNIGDINADGNPDLIIAVIGQRRIALMLGNGDGGFQRASFVNVPNEIKEVKLVDANNDDKLDIGLIGRRPGASLNYEVVILLQN